MNDENFRSVIQILCPLEQGEFPMEREDPLGDKGGSGDLHQKNLRHHGDTEGEIKILRYQTSLLRTSRSFFHSGIVLRKCEGDAPVFDFGLTGRNNITSFLESVSNNVQIRESTVRGRPHCICRPDCGEVCSIAELRESAV